MEIYKYRPWNVYTAAVIRHSQIFFPSKTKLNDPAELVHPIQFEESTWSESLQSAYNAIPGDILLEMDKIRGRFEQLEALFGHSDAVRDEEYRRYSDIEDRHLRALEALYDRVEVHEAIKYYALCHWQDRAQLYGTEEEIIARINGKLSALGVLSLSKRGDCPVMWNHYAGGHSGVVLIFDTGEDPMFAAARDVQYVNSRPVTTADNVSEVLYRKSDRWAYEAELRVLKKRGDECYSFSEQALVGVVLGVHMPKDKRQEVLRAVEKRGHMVSLYDAQANSSTFSIDRRPLDQ